MKDNTSSISAFTAATLSISYTIIYVLPFYLSTKTRPSPTLSRDAPAVIRARIRAVTLSCIVTSLFTTFVLYRYGRMQWDEILHLLGWYPISPFDNFRSLTLVIILFAGPLFESGIADGQWRAWSRGGSVADTLATSIGWRNYIASPVTEEVLFRSVIVPLHLVTGTFSPLNLILLTPLYFGLAHVHHAYEFRLTHPYLPILPIVLRTVFQFAYTSLFGFYAVFLFLRTGSIIPCILSHAFCNWMGLPRVWGRLEGLSGAPVMGPVDSGQDIRGTSNDQGALKAMQLANGRLSVGWTVTYYVLLVGGAWGFYANLWQLTESENSLVRF